MFKRKISLFLIFFLIVSSCVFSSEENLYKIAKVIRGGDSKQKLLALTFDDGPNDNSLLKILELLDEYKIKASFFFIGSYIEKYPDETIKTFNSGHLVLNHSYAHPNLKDATEDEVFLEISKANKVIKNILGVDSKFYRPPYGVITENKIKALGRLHMDLISWNVDTRDWSNRETLDSVIEITKKQTKPGSIILMHTQPGKMRTYEALKILIPHFKKEGYTFVKLDEILNIKGYR
ncbi:MAG: polysaccharide deacetylase family protein [Fusobacteriaceae bacterium]